MLDLKILQTLQKQCIPLINTDVKVLKLTIKRVELKSGNINITQTTLIDPYFTDYSSSTIEKENKEVIIIPELKYGD